MDDVALANYVAGSHSGHVEAGRLDHLCAELLGVEIGTQFWFSDYTLFKLKHKHGEINFSHYRHMPSIQLLGFVARGRNPNLLDLWWVNQVAGETVTYFVVLKVTAKREVFVSTFHPISLKEGRRFLRRALRKSHLMREQHGGRELLKFKG